MFNKNKINALLKKVDALEIDVIETEQKHHPALKHIHANHLCSAQNLLHYLAIRAHDLRVLQKSLSEMAISSISHSESYTLDNLQKVQYLLRALAGKKQIKEHFDCLDVEESAHILKHNSDTLLGKTTFHGQCKVMVTLSTDTADDYKLVSSMVKAGMDIARINTAHDNRDIWEKMIFNTRKAAKAHKKHVKIYMDVEGPKMRTGTIKPISSDHDEEKSKIPYIKLYKGSKLKIVKEQLDGHDGAQPVISLSIPEIFGYVKTGEQVWFDDGKLGGVIHSMDHKCLIVEIVNAPEEGFKLKAEKGINFPDSQLNLPALTREDLEHLEFISANADMVGYSFVQTPADVHLLQKHLARLGHPDMGIILKIETRLAFENLPSLLFAVMESPNCGLMIARGDLAVEIGYLRMAEVQEEILWLAEAAHMPVIWATQVLETQVKKGLATRAEISDVVKSVRAECVMLNKGPYIIEAIKTVKDIDKRMAAHEDKKQKKLRSLHVARAFLGV